MNGNILILDQFSELGGAQRCLLNLVPAFREAGYATHLAVPGDGALADCARSRGALVHYIPCGPYTSGRKDGADAARYVNEFPRQASRVAALVLKQGINLIYVNGPRLLPAAAMGRRSRPLIFHAHSVVAQNAAARLARWAIRSSNAHVVAACRFVLDPLAPAIRTGRSSVIYNGIVPMLYAARRHENGDPWRIGVIGRIAPEKGQLEFVRAARLIHERERCEFIVCGDALFSNSDYGQRVRAEADGLPIQFTGWQENVQDVLANLDLLIVPSASVDATPLVILEAFSAGIPVVAFRSGGIPEIVTDGVTGVLCSPSVQELASTVSQLLSGPQSVLDSLAEAAKAEFAARFCLKRFQSDVLNMVRRAITH
jgi:glycosyltransferase involved in cell wall biosynthesis